MRKIGIGIFIIMFSVSSQLMGQNGNHLNNMVVSSIKSYIEFDKDMARQGYYVCIDGLPSDFHSDSLQNVVFFSLNNLEGLPNAFKSKLNKGIKTLFIKMTLSNKQLDVTISAWVVKRLKKNNKSIAISDWGIFTYEYSCDSQIWELKETKFNPKNINKLDTINCVGFECTVKYKFEEKGIQFVQGIILDCKEEKGYNEKGEYTEYHQHEIYFVKAFEVY
jgi:hypothetical protein